MRLGGEVCASACVGKGGSLAAEAVAAAAGFTRCTCERVYGAIVRRGNESAQPLVYDQVSSVGTHVSRWAAKRAWATDRGAGAGLWARNSNRAGWQRPRLR